MDRKSLIQCDVKLCNFFNSFVCPCKCFCCFLSAKNFSVLLKEISPLKYLKGNIPCFTGDEIKDMESDTEWQFVTVGDQVTSMPC